jgi:hypothetical protein
MDEYFLLQRFYYTLDNLLKHEGEREVNGIGGEYDSPALESAKKDAEEVLAEGRKYFNL